MRICPTDHWLFRFRESGLSLCKGRGDEGDAFGFCFARRSFSCFGIGGLGSEDKRCGWGRIQEGSSICSCWEHSRNIRKQSHCFHVRPQTPGKWAISSSSNQGIQICLVWAPLQDAFVPSHMSIAKGLLYSWPHTLWDTLTSISIALFFIEHLFDCAAAAY